MVKTNFDAKFLSLEMPTHVLYRGFERPTFVVMKKKVTFIMKNFSRDLK